MEMSTVVANWFSEQEVDEYSYSNDQPQMNSLDWLDNIQNFVTEPDRPKRKSSSSSESSRPSKQMRANSWNSRFGATSSVSQSPNRSSSTSIHSNILSFENPPDSLDHSLLFPNNMEPENKMLSALVDVRSCYNHPEDSYFVNIHCPQKPSHQLNKKTDTFTRTASRVQEHVLAERKRREKLSQRFVALSALIPGLKKLDKASVLEDAIKHIKQIQERVKVLEAQAKRKADHQQSVVFVSKSELSEENNFSSSSCDDQKTADCAQVKIIPEIEARFSEKDVLIKIHCRNQDGLAVKLLSQVDKLHLSLLNISVIPFGNFADIRVTAQMEPRFGLTAKDLVRKLKLAL